MKDREKLELLKEVVLQKRNYSEEKKAVNEEIESARKSVEEEIMDGGTLEVAKEKFSLVIRKTIERKDLNAKVKRLDSSIGKIVMGEEEYDDDQMTIDDILYEENKDQVPEVA